jgi:hypothetical protein
MADQTNPPDAPQADAPHLGAFDSAEAAQAVKPYRLFRVVSSDGKAAWTWANSHVTSVGQVARARGWTATPAGKPADKQKVADLLGQLSPEVRQALLAQYAQPNGTTPATTPAADKPQADKAKSGKGK